MSAIRKDVGQFEGIFGPSPTRTRQDRRGTRCGRHGQHSETRLDAGLDFWSPNLGAEAITIEVKIPASSHPGSSPFGTTADDAIQGARQLGGGFRRYAWATCLGTAILAATNCVNPSAFNANYLRVPGVGLALRQPAMAPASSSSSMTETVWLDGREVAAVRVPIRVEVMSKAGSTRRTARFCTNVGCDPTDHAPTHLTAP